MLIQPSTTVKLLKNCPLDNKYTHTIAFNSIQEQVDYFNGLCVKTLTKLTYQRVDLGIIRVEAKIEDIYGCNYMMFKNENFENKWFYAFIKKVEYINNITCNIHYEIDVMQTWWLDWKFLDCFVEREHSEFNDLETNFVDENIDCGPYMYRESNYTMRDAGGVTQLFVDEFGYNLNTLRLIIMFRDSDSPLDFTEHPDIAPLVHGPGIYGGLYTDLKFFAFGVSANADNRSRIEAAINLITMSKGKIEAVFMMPTMFVPLDDDYSNAGISVYGGVIIPKTIGAYTPRNKKLLTYPYSCAYLTSHRGEGQELKYELFQPGETDQGESFISFECIGSFNPNGSIIAFPVWYAGKRDCIELNVSIPAYPIPYWGADGWAEYISNHLVGLGMVENFAKTAINTGASLFRGNTAGAVTGVANYAVNEAIGYAKSYANPGESRGGGNSDTLYTQKRGRMIDVYNKTITEQYAAILDDYFDRYGYKTNKVKKPNYNSRPHWNYVKTIGCAIQPKPDYGGVPTDDIAKICSIFDNGITLWKKGDEVGKYTLNNDPGGR